MDTNSIAIGDQVRIKVPPVAPTDVATMPIDRPVMTVTKLHSAAGSIDGAWCEWTDSGATQGHWFGLSGLEPVEAVPPAP